MLPKMANAPTLVLPWTGAIDVVASPLVSSGWSCWCCFFLGGFGCFVKVDVFGGILCCSWWFFKVFCLRRRPSIRCVGRWCFGSEAAALVSADEVTIAAHTEARRIIEEAEHEAQRKQAEVDAYVDGKLAAFEGTLEHTLEAVTHGRAKLAGQTEEHVIDEVLPQ